MSKKMSYNVMRIYTYRIPIGMDAMALPLFQSMLIGTLTLFEILIAYGF